MCLHLCGKASSRNLRFYFKCEGGKACISTWRLHFVLNLNVTLKFKYHRTKLTETLELLFIIKFSVTHNYVQLTSTVRCIENF